MVCFTGLTWLQLLVGQCQSLDNCRGNQLCHRVRTETLSSDESLGFPETFWPLRKQQFLQNGSWFLTADLSEGTLQLLKGNRCRKGQMFLCGQNFINRLVVLVGTCESLMPPPPSGFFLIVKLKTLHVKSDTLKLQLCEKVDYL